MQLGSLTFLCSAWRGGKLVRPGGNFCSAGGRPVDGACVQDDADSTQLFAPPGL